MKKRGFKKKKLVVSDKKEENLHENCDFRKGKKSKVIVIRAKQKI